MLQNLKTCIQKIRNIINQTKWRLRVLRRRYNSWANIFGKRLSRHTRQKVHTIMLAYAKFNTDNNVIRIKPQVWFDYVLKGSMRNLTKKLNSRFKKILKFNTKSCYNKSYYKFRKQIKLIKKKYAVAKQDQLNASLYGLYAGTNLRFRIHCTKDRKLVLRRVGDVTPPVVKSPPFILNAAWSSLLSYWFWEHGVFTRWTVMNLSDFIYYELDAFASFILFDITESALIAIAWIVTAIIWPVIKWVCVTIAVTLKFVTPKIVLGIIDVIIFSMFWILQAFLICILQPYANIISLLLHVYEPGTVIWIFFKELFEPIVELANPMCNWFNAFVVQNWLTCKAFCAMALELVKPLYIWLEGYTVKFWMFIEAFLKPITEPLVTFIYWTGEDEQALICRNILIIWLLFLFVLKFLPKVIDIMYERRAAVLADELKHKPYLQEMWRKHPDWWHPHFNKTMP